MSDWQPLTARRVAVLLGYGATFINGERGEDVAVQMPDGHTVRWDDPALATEIGEFLERDVRLVQSATGIHDAAPVHVITEASVQQMADWMLGDVDRRRSRANVIVETDDGWPFVEADWPGHQAVCHHHLRPRHPRPEHRGPRRHRARARAHVRGLLPRGAWRLGAGGGPGHDRPGPRPRICLIPTPTSWISRSGGARSPGDGAGW